MAWDVGREVDDTPDREGQPDGTDLDNRREAAVGGRGLGRYRRVGQLAILVMMISVPICISPVMPAV